MISFYTFIVFFFFLNLFFIISVLKFELQTACAGPLCAAISGRGTIGAAPDVGGWVGGEFC